MSSSLVVGTGVPQDTWNVPSLQQSSPPGLQVEPLTHDCPIVQLMPLQLDAYAPLQHTNPPGVQFVLQPWPTVQAGGGVLQEPE